MLRIQDTIDPIPDAVGHKSKESSTQTAVYYTEDSETQAPVLRTIAVEACIASEIPGQEEAQSSQQFLGTDESRWDYQAETTLLAYHRISHRT